VNPVQRLASTLLLVCAYAALARAGAAHDAETQTRIEHLDGSGRATVVDVEPSVPGAAAFIHSTPGPIPRPGEIIVPPTETPTRAPRPAPTPRRQY